MKTLTFLKPADDRLTAEQPRAILKCLAEKFGPEVAVTFEDLGAALKDEPTFVSRQKPDLVVAYYARRLADKGYCKYDITEDPSAPDAILLPEVPGEVEMDPIDAPAEFKDEAKPKAGVKANGRKPKGAKAK